MRHEKAYWTDDKVHLHERLHKLSQTWGMSTGMKDVVLDCFIISVTPYDELRNYYADGNWSMQQFAEAHVLFFERSDQYDYAKTLFV